MPVRLRILRYKPQATDPQLADAQFALARDMGLRAGPSSLPASSSIRPTGAVHHTD